MESQINIAQKNYRGKMQLFAEKIGDALCEQLASSETLPPWEKPYDAYGTRRFAEAFNASTRREYRGGNALACILHKLAHGYKSGAYLTFKQALDLGGNVRKGEKSLQVIKVGTSADKREQKNDADAKDRDKNEERKTSFFIRFYAVFNVEQCDGIDLEKFLPAPLPPKTWENCAECEKIIAAQGIPVIQNANGGTACFSPLENVIRIPAIDYWTDAESYYSTIFHELSHAAAAAMNMNFGGYETTEGRAREEAAVELAALTICGTLGIGKPEADDNHKAYAAHWLKKVRADKTEVLRAWEAAQIIAEKILKAAN